MNGHDTRVTLSWQERNTGSVRNTFRNAFRPSPFGTFRNTGLTVPPPDAMMGYFFSRNFSSAACGGRFLTLISSNCR